jgi:hypothetical protein
VLAKMARDQTGVSVIAAAGRTANNESDRLALVKRLLRAG